MDFLIEPWQSGIERRALVEVALLGATCGALSFWIVGFRLSYPAESLAHGLVPGLVIAALLGFPLLVGGTVGVAAAAGTVWLAERYGRIDADAATAIAVTGLLGLGALLALSPDAPARLEELLFGNPLGVGDGDLIAAACLAAAGGAALIALHRPLTAIALDPVGARALGVRVGAIRLALLTLLATALVIAVQGLGSLLVLAILVAPAVAVHGHSSSPVRAMLAGSATAIAAGMAGIYASHVLGTAAGASIALALCLAAGLGAGLGPGPVAQAGLNGGSPLRSRASQ